MRYSRWTSVALLGCVSPVAMAVEPFTVVVIPDPQNYVGSATNNNKYFKGQTRWIVNNTASNNIAFTMVLGDMQNPGNPYRATVGNWYVPDLSRKTTDPADEQYWMRADEAMDILDAGRVNYSMVPGNHDYLNANDPIEPIYWLKWFGPQRFTNKPTYRGASPEVPGATSSDPPVSYAGMNTWHVFEAGGRQYLNVALQFGPNTHDLRWAQSIINQNPGIPTIVTTHAHLNNSGYQAGYKNIWDDFVKNNPQVIMTLNGHITGEFHQSPNNIAGLPVHQMLVDYQATEFPNLYPDDFRGAGFMRLMQFDPDAKVVRVKSFSPAVNNGTGGYLTDGDSQFNLPLDLDARFGAAPTRPGYARTISLRDGVGGYTGTRDTQLDGSAATTDLGEQAFIWADGDAPGGTKRQGLVRFESLFSAGRIPAGVVIKSAKLTLTTDTATDSQSSSNMSLYRMLSSWSEASTWDGMTGGVSADGGEAILAANGTVVPNAQGGTVSFDVTESLFAWQSGAPIRGWAILPGGGNGWRFVSSEGQLGMRPVLEVEYLVPAIFGDANADERVDADDFALVDRGLARGLRGWANGDFNDDGVVNQADYLLLDRSYALQEGGLSESFVAMREAQFGVGYTAALMAAVPEPAVGLLAACGAVLVGGRRRR